MKKALDHIKDRKGFTLIELIMVMGLFGFASALLMQNLFSIYHFKEVIRYKKDINFEASAVLNNGIAGMVRSGFAINYDETDSQVSNRLEEGLRSNTDRISIFTDRAETQYFTIFRDSYHEGEGGEQIAQLMIEFSDGEIFPLHSSETVIEDFDIEVPTDPRLTGDRDIQPYVNLYLRARRRHSLSRNSDESELMAHENVIASYQTTYMLRNTVPSSYKNLALNN